MTKADDRAASRTALYRFYNPSGDLLYVGISVRPWTRWKQHKGQKDWAEEVATQTIEWWPTRAEALVAEKEAIIAEEPLYNVIHNGDSRMAPPPPPAISDTPEPEAQWVFESRKYYAGNDLRVTPLYLVPEPNGLAVLSDYLDDDLTGDDQVEIYMDYLDRVHGGAPAYVPIYWTIDGPDAGVMEEAPIYAYGETHVFTTGYRTNPRDPGYYANNFLSHYTWPEHHGTGNLVNFYRLPIRHRFPAFWKAIDYEPSPLQPYFPVEAMRA